MLYKKSGITLLFIVAVIAASFAQNHVSSFEKRYSSAQLKYDYDFAKLILEKAHPSLYRYSSQDSINYYFSLFRSEIDTSMTASRFWVLLQQAVVKIRSGHTTMQPGKDYLDSINTHDEKIFPFIFLIRNDHIFIERYFFKQDTTLKRNDEILSINGESSPDLLAKLRNLLPADGFNNGRKDEMLRRGFSRLYFWSHKKDSTYNLEIRRGAAVANVKIHLYTIHRNTVILRKKTLNGDPEGSEPEVFYPSVLPATAVLRIENFAYNNFTDFHRNFFRNIRKNKINNLIIDLRDNNGGEESVCIDLLNYLINKPYLFIYKYSAATNSGVLKKYNDLYNLNVSEASARLFTQNISVKNYVFMGTVNRSTNRLFKGNIYVLINEGTFSAASLFAITLKLFRDCTTVGSETGGGLAGTDGKEILHITLPNTKLQLLLPLVYGYTAAKTPGSGRGLAPDFKRDIDRTEFFNYNNDGEIYKLLAKIIDRKN